MERRHNKLLASASYQAQGVRACSTTETMNDRFSNLADEVAHHILSFLAITDLTRFGCASKRCIQLYLSTPSLNFDEISTNNSLNLLSSLDRFLMHRGNNKIQRFRIGSCVFWIHLNEIRSFCKDVKFRMMTWIHYAVKCNVEVIHLGNFTSYCYLDKEYYASKETPSFPSCVFLCESLRSLFVGMHCKMPKAPSLTSFSNLEYLRFRFVHVSDEGIFKWISCCCKCIKELHLEHVGGIHNVTIESSSLISFRFKHAAYRDFHICHLNISGEKIEEIHVDWKFDSPGNKSLNILAPGLKYLKLEGNLSIHLNLGSFMCLEKAELLLEPKADEFNIVFEVTCSIRRAKVLVLNKETTMALFKGGSMPIPLENVCYLSINLGSWLNILVSELVCFLGGMPNLSSLEIKSDPHFLGSKTGCYGFNMKSQNLAFIDQLKEVTIEISNEFDGIEFAKYLLRHAQNLKKMVMVHSPEQSNAIRRLNKSKRTSNTTLVFQEDQNRSNQRAKK